MTAPQKRQRCAIYTRKSTEEGLEQQFNSLDAQRESCEAYILSQTGEGWEWTRARIVIGLLAPDIQKAILQGTAPKGLDPDLLFARDFPLDWGEQRQMIGMSA